MLNVLVSIRVRSIIANSKFFEPLLIPEIIFLYVSRYFQTRRNLLIKLCVLFSKIKIETDLHVIFIPLKYNLVVMDK